MSKHVRLLPLIFREITLWTVVATYESAPRWCLVIEHSSTLLSSFAVRQSYQEVPGPWRERALHRYLQDMELWFKKFAPTFHFDFISCPSKHRQLHFAVGDDVIITECMPISKRKRFEVVRIVRPVEKHVDPETGKIYTKADWLALVRLFLNFPGMRLLFR